MTAKTKPAALASRWLRSKTGRCYAYVIVCSQRDAKGRILYRLRYLDYGVTSKKTWTIDDLKASGCRFLKNKPTKAMVDNARCFVCHLNYQKEEIALNHAKADIGCAECHGNCDKHIADESWASGGNGTPPEIMYRRNEVNPACLKCHTKSKMDEDAHEEFFAGKTEERHCTDCHGEHRLTERKCKWK